MLNTYYHSTWGATSPDSLFHTTYYVQGRDVWFAMSSRGDIKHTCKGFPLHLANVLSGESFVAEILLEYAELIKEVEDSCVAANEDWLEDLLSAGHQILELSKTLSWFIGEHYEVRRAVISTKYA